MDISKIELSHCYFTLYDIEITSCDNDKIKLHNVEKEILKQLHYNLEYLLYDESERRDALDKECTDLRAKVEELEARLDVYENPQDYVSNEEV